MEIQHNKKVSRALISVYDKEPARLLIETLHKGGVELISTGGTLSFIREMGLEVTAVEELTGYPSIFGGRVKTLHPMVFGGILGRPSLASDQLDMQRHEIDPIDMVVVDLYPFEKTLSSGASHDEMIEKIDIGGVSLIRAAAKNYAEILVVPAENHYSEIINLLTAGNWSTSLLDRKRMAAAAMEISSHYDALIFDYLNDGELNVFKESIRSSRALRYGENPHQQGCYYGDLDTMFEQLSGKPLSYNNLLDIDAAVALIAEFSEPTFAIIKHTNPCGLATRDTVEEAWHDALAGDPVSAFGGVLIANREMGADLAESIHELFFEVLIAPGFEQEALDILSAKKNRIILRKKPFIMPDYRFRSALNGVLWQTQDHKSTVPELWKSVTTSIPDKDQEKDLVFANMIVKHLKSNAIALVKDSMLLGTGMGQTSRVDALNHAIAKARSHGHDLKGAVMASDAFFPFADSVEIASNAGVSAVIQPGGSVRDQDSIDFCNAHGMAMVMTGVRHFKH